MRKPASKLSSAIHPPSDPLADKMLTDRFRELAARFSQWAAGAEGGTLPRTGLDFINQVSADEDAGRLVIWAFHGGHLRDIPHLTELVDWAESKGDYPVAPTFVRCPGNLFGEVVGGGKIQIRNTPGRTVKRGNSVSMDPQDVADEPLGGLLSERFPALDEPDRNLKHSLTASPKNRDWFLLKHEAVGFRRRARACRLLADMIAQGPPAPANVSIQAEAVNVTTPSVNLAGAKAARAPGGAPAVGKPEAATVPEGAPALGYRFAYDPGGHWLVQYEDRKVGLFPNDLGFRYIHELICQQERPVSAVVLRDHCRPGGPGRPLVTVEDVTEDTEDAEDTEPTLGRQMGGGEMADKETLAKVRRQIDDWEAEREACTDPIQAAEIRESIAKAQKYLNQAKDPTGRLRPMPGDYRKKAADSVRAAIQVAIRKIKKCDTPCGLHFRRNIRCGTSPSYDPNPPVQWDIS